MKTLRTVLAAVLMVLSFSAFATDDSKNEKLQLDHAVNTYIDAMVHGNIKGLYKVLDADVKFTLTVREKIRNYGRQAMMSHLKNIENVEQNCSTSVEVLDITPTQAVVKVRMEYSGFSRINFVTIANSSNGWKITNISSAIV
ncbi:nuclear transport factor 2 family protein [Pedobacter sp. SYSU D00535]|uniref:nuclear transport factor 2 family protein n=1 Tax=Pedobacter sp. SYSU D00535 TaxID=2810308 RepID=UPI001A95877E|nr:nuclear transport factor 2 family protein [Pedobacter sp. SYSU D00535]